MFMIPKWNHTALILFLFGILFILPNESSATHLIGGTISYEDLGPVNTTSRRYRIFTQIYMDCNSPSWGTLFPGGSIQVGIYEGVLNPPNNLPNTREITLFLEDTTWIDPNLPPACIDSLNLIGGTCIFLVEFSNTVVLNPTTKGYHIIYDRCCRPGNIMNLANSGNQGFAFTTWIPANQQGFIPNSGPTFADTLVSYLCKGDTNYLPNIAIDPDGDSLVYSLEVPFRGMLGNGQNGNPPPQASYGSISLDPYTFSVPNTFWNTGHNFGQMFGAGGYHFIDPGSGIAQFAANLPGYYAIAIEIKEYRNGQQIGYIRRNIQVMVDDCPDNDAPYQDVSNLSNLSLTPTRYEVEEGQNFCFNLKYKDPDEDSLTIKASGSVFDPSVTTPQATLSYPTIADDSITAQFCWTPSCDESKNSPRKFNVTVTDVACPPLPLIQEVEIIINPFIGPSSIAGDDLACKRQQHDYSIGAIPGVTYTWMVDGGTIVSGGNTPVATIEWGDTTSGNVSMFVTSQFGCNSDTLNFPVNFSIVPVDAGLGGVICPGDSIQIGGAPTTSPNYTVDWSPPTDITSTTSFNPIVFPDLATTYYVEATDTLGCKWNDSVFITTHPYVPSDLQDEYFICIGDTIQITSNVGSVYRWSPTTGISDSTVNNPKFFGKTTETYYINYDDHNGCRWYDTILVEVGSIVPTEAGDPGTICQGDSFVIGGNPTAPPFSHFEWDNIVFLDDKNAPNPTAFPMSTTLFTIRTFADTCSGVDTVRVVVLPEPQIGLLDNASICKGDTLLLRTNGLGSYSWSGVGGLSSSSDPNPLVQPTASTYYFVTVSDTFGCTSTDSVFIHVQEYPIANAGGVIPGCDDEETTLGGNYEFNNNYQFRWTPGELLNDSTIANPITVLHSPTHFVLSVTDSIGCTSVDSAFADIHICDCKVYIPNAFTPDGDGLNDEFYPGYYCEFEYFNFSIFDRWGNLVFETDDSEVFWNGHYEGELAMQGVYVYKLVYKSIFGSEIEKIGQVTLISK